MTDFAGLRVIADPRMPPGVAALVSPGHPPMFITGLASEGTSSVATLPPIVQSFDADLTPLREHVRALAHGLAAFADTLEPEPQASAEYAAGKAEADAAWAAMAPEDDGLTGYLVYYRRCGDPGGEVHEHRATCYGISDDGWIHFVNRAADRVASYRADTVEWIQVSRP